MTTRNWLALAAFGLVLASCASPPPPAPPPPPPPPSTGETSYDLSGESPSCAAPVIVSVADGVPLNFTMALNNDGGWCGLRLARNGAPLAAGLLPQMPLHGIVFIHRVQKFTRIDYTPNGGFAGTDSFLVKLLPGYLPVKVTVTVAGPASTPNPSPKP